MTRVITIGSLGLCLVACAGTLGGKTRDALRQSVTERQAQLGACYQAALVRNRDAAGTIEVAVHVQRKQTTVHHVDVVQSGISDQELQTCVKQALTDVTIAEAPGQNVRAHFALAFQPNGELAAVSDAGPAADAGAATP